HTLWQVLETSLCLLHPFMPFITEEIWQSLPKNASHGETIMLRPWPEAGAADPRVEAEMAAYMEIIRAVRNLRAQMNIPPGKKVTLFVRGSAPLGEQGSQYICQLAGVESLQQIDQVPE